MKLFIALAFVAVATALPMLKPAVSNGVLLEESASRPTMAKGIRTDCNYETYDDRDLGHVFAHGDSTVYTPSAGADAAEAREDALKEAKVACDEMGPDCGGVVENADGGFQTFMGTVLKKKDGSKAHVKGLCAFPLPYTNFWKGTEHHDDTTDRSDGKTGTDADNTDPKTVYKFNHVTNTEVERLRWKLSNGPAYTRIDDGKDHGSASRIVDGKSEAQTVEDCMALCAKRTDCMSGHYCESGEGAMSGKCMLSGDWDPYGIEPDYDGCSVYRNFRQAHEWVKPVERLDDGKYVKEQWHSKTPIDVAYAQQAEGYDQDDGYLEEDDA